MSAHAVEDWDSNARLTTRSRGCGRGSKPSIPQGSQVTTADPWPTGRKSGELEEEITRLKRQLSVYEGTVISDLTSASTTHPTASFHLESSVTQTEQAMNERSTHCFDPMDRMLTTTMPSGISLDSPDQSSLPGTTTIPNGTIPAETPPRIVQASSARKIRDIELTKDEINDLFQIYFSHYHVFLPFLDPSVSPDRYYDQSALLFWSIVSVASRRYQANPTLLPRLARTLTDTLWKSLQALPHSLAVVQSLVLICTWPFPTSSSSTDPSYMLSGMGIQLGLSMGLHRPNSPEDFTKFHVNLDSTAMADRGRAWVASNVVAQSCGVGLPTPAHVRDWSLVTSSLEAPWLDENLRAHLRCASVCNRISQALASNPSDHTGLLQPRERLPVYTILNHEIVDLESSRSWTRGTTAVYLQIAKLHLQAFYLFDDASTFGYVERIVVLYSTASALLEHIQTLDNQKSDFLYHCPFFCYEAFLCASFIVLKVLKNDYFSAIVDARLGKKLINFSVSALRKMSVANNDLPGRLSDVLAYLWTHPDPSIASGSGIDGLQLKVQSRMSMSIVYDSLWRWREQFRIEAERELPGEIPSGNDPPFGKWYSQLNGAGTPLAAQRTQNFDLAFDLADLNGIYSDDFQFDWFT
ncbi:C6 transcription factor [Cladophialophora carrionii]|uniref:C6 transcription factor n=1 Tax=Cladophialophora carrionii TaxID=86049 RepID=A0A1C1CSL8_9EURO|nr:C6 transcription factor [Cladophialophora carrionii]